MLNSGSSENAPYETVWKIVRVASRPYVSPTGGGKTGRLALLVDSWKCQYWGYSEFPNSFSRHWCENPVE